MPASPPPHICYIRSDYLSRHLGQLRKIQNEQVRRYVLKGEKFTRPPLLQGIPYAPDPTSENLDLLAQMIEADATCQKKDMATCTDTSVCTAGVSADGHHPVCRISDNMIIQSILDNPESAEWPGMTNYNTVHGLPPAAPCKAYGTNPSTTPYFAAIKRLMEGCAGANPPHSSEFQQCVVDGFGEDCCTHLPPPPPLIMDYFRQTLACLDNTDATACAQHAACTWQPPPSP